MENSELVGETLNIMNESEMRKIVHDFVLGSSLAPRAPKLEPFDGSSPQKVINFSSNSNFLQYRVVGVKKKNYRKFPCFSLTLPSDGFNGMLNNEL